MSHAVKCISVTAPLKHEMSDNFSLRSFQSGVFVLCKSFERRSLEGTKGKTPARKTDIRRQASPHPAVSLLGSALGYPKLWPGSGARLIGLRCEMTGDSSFLRDPTTAPLPIYG